MIYNSRSTDATSVAQRSPFSPVFSPGGMRCPAVTGKALPATAIDWNELFQEVDQGGRLPPLP